MIIYVCICTYIFFVSFCLPCIYLFKYATVCPWSEPSNYRTQEMGWIPGWSRKRAENFQLFPYQLDLHSANFSQFIKRRGLDKSVSNTSFAKTDALAPNHPCADFAHRITGIIFAWVFKCHAAYRCIVTYIARTQCFIIISPCRPKDSWTLSMSNSTPCIFVSSKVCQYRDFGFRKRSRVWISRYVTPQLLSGRSTIIQHHIFKTCPDHTKSGH